MQLIHVNQALRALALAFALALAPVSAMAEEDAEPVTVARDGELFTITITEATPVEDVLSEIAETVDAEVEGGEDAGDVGPLKLVRVSLNQALRVILQKRSFAMKYEDGSGDPALIHIAARKATPAPDVVDEVTPEAAPEEPPADPLGALVRSRSKPANPAAAKGGIADFQARPRNPNIKECADLMKLPQNRGKQSETLITAEGQPCPPGIKVFGN